MEILAQRTKGRKFPAETSLPRGVFLGTVGHSNLKTMKRSPTENLRLSFLLLMFFAIGISAAAATSKPNIVFFLADDLGQRDLGCYGSAFYETPNLDRLAKEGARFTDAYAACAVCSPTRASIMTGQWPQRTS